MRNLRFLFFLLLLLFCRQAGYAQLQPCGGVATSAGLITPCLGTGVSQSVNNNQYVLIDVVLGFSYTISVSPTGGGGSYTITNESGTNSFGTVPPTFFPLTQPAPYTGQVRVYNCTGGTRTITVTVDGGSNTQDNPAAAGTDAWVAHVYQWTGGSPPTQAAAFSRYIGVYTNEAEIFNEGFGGGAGCMDVQSAGNVRIQQDRANFAVRFRNNTTKPPGAYIATFAGDDGMRFYSDGTLYFDGWRDQGVTTYAAQLFPVTTSGNLLYEYYESGGGNEARFNNFARVSNSVTPVADQTVCAGGAAGLLTGTNTFTSAPLNSDGAFTVSYQWQQSPDSAAWTSISGAINATYTPPAAIAGTLFYRRVATVGRANTNVNGAAINVSVPDISNAVMVTVRAAPTATVTAPAAVCQGSSEVVTFGNPQSVPITLTFKLNNGPNQTLNVGASSTATALVPTSSVSTQTYALVSVQYQNTPVCSTPVSGTAAVSVRALPTATVTGGASVCNGATANATFTNPQALPVTVTYKVNGGADQTLNIGANTTATAAVATGTAGTQVFTLVSTQYQDVPACVNTLSGNTTFTVLATPTVTISGTDTVCLNTPASILITNPQASSVVVSYTRNGTAVTVTIGANATATVAAATNVAGTFTYTLTSVRYQASPTCDAPATGSVALTVLPNPNVTISGGATGCEGVADDVTFTTTSAQPVTVTYKLNGGPNQTANVAAASSTNVPVPTGAAGSYVYTLVSVQYQLAPACPITLTASTTFTIRPTPTVIISGDTTVCQGQGTIPVVRFTNPQNVAIRARYRINGGAISAPTVNAGSTVSLTRSTNAATTFTYTLVDVYYNSNPRCTTSVAGTAVVTVVASPAGTIDAPAICQGEPALLTYNATAGTGPFTLVINSQTYNNIGSGTPFPAAPPPAGTTTYNLTQITDANSCALTSP